MKTLNKILLRIYPSLIAIYPVLALRNFNSAYVDLASIFRSLIIVVSVTALVWLIGFAIFRDWNLTGILASLVMIIALAYGHLYNQIENVLGHPIRHIYLATILGVLFGLACWLLITKRNIVGGVGQFLANTALILVVMSLWQSLTFAYSQYGNVRELVKPNKAINTTDLPDIYLIVLDAHGRSDVLKDIFGYDNSQFIHGLTDLGFYVAQCSQSNYASTKYSLTSMFQMDYIQLIDGRDRIPALKNTPLLQTLRANGYSIITFENYVSGHFDLGEDLRLSHHQLIFGATDLSGGLNEFEKTMLDTSIARLFLDTEIVPGFNENGLVRLEDYEHYLQTKYILQELPKVPQLKSPKFVLVHILVPHIPQIFTPDGKFRYPEDTSKNGYRDNAEFIDQAILPAIRQVIAESAQPPVIILMGDHGPPATKFTSPEARMKNLDAYLVNSEAKAKLYNSITPVNSFRIILNKYFGGNYPLLSDVSYYAYQLRQLKASPIMIKNTCSTQ